MKDRLLIDTQEALEDVCTRLLIQPYITIDTEFLREHTYWPQLCVIQVGWRNTKTGKIESVLVDPQSGIDLSALYAVFENEKVTKVFHAARQDLEAFYHLAGIIPSPLFDTQLAGMVCGYGEQVGYATLVHDICQVDLDKSSRVTDWAQRPLSDEQLAYARADVTHLCDVYEVMVKKLADNNRISWLEEELAVLYDSQTYVVDEHNAWQRIKIRNLNNKSIHILYELAKWREEEARTRNVPRNRLVKDDTLADIALTRPVDRDSMYRIRSVQRERMSKDTEQAVMAAVQRGLNPSDKDADNRPVLAPRTTVRLDDMQRLRKDMLRILLTVRANTLGVAARLIASSKDLEKLVLQEPDVLTGWRYDLFGKDAQALLAGELGLTIENNDIKVKQV